MNINACRKLCIPGTVVDVDSQENYSRLHCITGSGSKRGSLCGGSDLGLEDHPGGYPGDPGHLPPPGGGLHPENTDQYYADQYDQYYRWPEYRESQLKLWQLVVNSIDKWQS